MPPLGLAFSCTRRLPYRARGGAYYLEPLIRATSRPEVLGAGWEPGVQPRAVQRRAWHSGLPSFRRSNQDQRVLVEPAGTVLRIAILEMPRGMFGAPRSRGSGCDTACRI